MSDDVDPETDALFDLAADAFVAARDALAKARRAAGDRASAASVKQLRRPTLSAWALNQLARRHPDDVRTLVDQGTALAAAQDQALAGATVDLREPGRARMETLRRLTRAAEAELAGQGSTGHRDEVVATLTAASVDQASAALLLQGRLSEPLAAPSGFGGHFSAPAGSPEPTTRRAARKASRDTDASRPAARTASRGADASDPDDGGDEESRTLDASVRAEAAEAEAAAAGGKARRAAVAEGKARRAAAAEGKARRAAAAEGKARREAAATAEVEARRATAAAREAASVAAAAVGAAEAAAQQVAAIEGELRRAREVLAEAEQEAGRRRRAAASATEAAADAARKAVHAGSDGSSA